MFQELKTFRDRFNFDSLLGFKYLVQELEFHRNFRNVPQFDVIDSHSYQKFLKYLSKHPSVSSIYTREVKAVIPCVVVLNNKLQLRLVAKAYPFARSTLSFPHWMYSPVVLTDDCVIARNAVTVIDLTGGLCSSADFSTTIPDYCVDLISLINSNSVSRQVEIVSEYLSNSNRLEPARRNQDDALFPRAMSAPRPSSSTSLPMIASNLLMALYSGNINSSNVPKRRKKKRRDELRRFKI